jgi:hypothetical protein
MVRKSKCRVFPSLVPNYELHRVVTSEISANKDAYTSAVAEAYEQDLDPEVWLANMASVMDKHLPTFGSVISSLMTDASGLYVKNDVVATPVSSKVYQYSNPSVGHVDALPSKVVFEQKAMDDTGRIITNTVDHYTLKRPSDAGVKPGIPNLVLPSKSVHPINYALRSFSLSIWLGIPKISGSRIFFGTWEESYQVWKSTRELVPYIVQAEIPAHKRYEEFSKLLTQTASSRYTWMKETIERSSWDPETNTATINPDYIAREKEITSHVVVITSDVTAYILARRNGYQEVKYYFPAVDLAKVMKDTTSYLYEAPAKTGYAYNFSFIDIKHQVAQFQLFTWPDSSFSGDERHTTSRFSDWWRIHPYWLRDVNKARQSSEFNVTSFLLVVTNVTAWDINNTIIYKQLVFPKTIPISNDIAVPAIRPIDRTMQYYEHAGDPHLVTFIVSHGMTLMQCYDITRRTYFEKTFDAFTDPCTWNIVAFKNFGKFYFAKVLSSTLPFDDELPYTLRLILNNTGGFDNPIRKYVRHSGFQQDRWYVPAAKVYNIIYTRYHYPKATFDPKIKANLLSKHFTYPIYHVKAVGTALAGEEYPACLDPCFTGRNPVKITLE